MSKIQITEENQNQRLDHLLVTQLPELSRNRIQNLIKDGHITVNNQTTKKNYILQIEDQIKVTIPKPVKSKHNPKDLELDIIYEDKDVIVINKPSGISVHPSDEHDQKTTIVNALLAYCKDLSGIGGVLRPGIIHRLDKETTGVLITAKNDQAHRFIAEQFSNRTVKKWYKTLVNGRIKPEKGRIDSPIMRHAIDRKKMGVSSNTKAREAITEYETISYHSDRKTSYSLLSVRIFTGRTHQIRVHLNAIGYPVVGDKLYGNQKANSYFAQKYNLNRQFLHASKLEVTLPNGKKVLFEAQLPSDLQTVLDSL